MTAPAPEQQEQYVERLGRRRAAALLAELTGQDITPDDIDDLAAADALHWTGEYEGHRLVDVDSLRELAARDDVAQLLAEHRLLGPNQSAAWLGIRPSDFAYVTQAGWLPPYATRHRQFGRSKIVPFAVYHVGQLAALLELPDVDWEAVRNTPARRRSPLRKLVSLPPTRAQVIHLFCARMARRHRVQVWPWWHNAADVWYVDWETRNGKPDKATLSRALARDKLARAYTKEIVFGSDRGLIVQWAREVAAPGVSCVLDTETHDLHGRVCEIAVIDTATGQTLLDTLVNPGVPMEPGAQAVHGISDAAVADAPTFDQVWLALVAAVGQRTVLAYNSDYDRNVICAHARAVGIDPGRLGSLKAWDCLMQARSAWMGTSRWMRLDGGHRALGDVLKARQVLMEMTVPFT